MTPSIRLKSPKYTPFRFQQQRTKMEHPLSTLSAIMLISQIMSSPRHEPGDVIWGQ